MFNRNPPIKSDNDIAILETHEKIRFNAYVQPVCIPSKEETSMYDTGNPVVISGWGRSVRVSNDENDETIYPDFLQAAQIQIVDREFCKYAHQGKLNLYGSESAYISLSV